MPQENVQTLPSRKPSKVAHVRRCGSEKILHFNKAQSRSLPPGMLFGQDIEVYVYRASGSFQITSAKLANRGVALSDLTDNDRVELFGVEDFYDRLFEAALGRPGLVVSMDPDLKASLELARGSQLTIGKQFGR